MLLHVIVCMKNYTHTLAHQTETRAKCVKVQPTAATAVEEVTVHTLQSQAQRRTRCSLWRVDRNISVNSKQWNSMTTEKRKQKSDWYRTKSATS